jgi:hypothetical protein
MVAQNAMANPMANVGPTPIKGHEANAMAHAGCVLHMIDDLQVMRR